MKFDYYKYFHQLTTNRSIGGRVLVPDDPAQWPPDWKEVHNKKYTFFKEVPLPPAGGDFYEHILTKRHSNSAQLLENKISIGDVAYILKCGYGLSDTHRETSGQNVHRTVPSAGARYPLEIYLILFTDLEALSPGIYHYNVGAHALETVQQRTFTSTDLTSISPLPWFPNTHGLVCMSAVFNRTINKYGTRGYRYIVLEAGHAAQNMQLAATERGAVLIPVGGVEDVVLEEMICLNDDRERLVYCLCF